MNNDSGIPEEFKMTVRSPDGNRKWIFVNLKKVFLVVIVSVSEISIEVYLAVVLSGRK